jgi:hypothetical protein
MPAPRCSRSAPWCSCFPTSSPDATPCRRAIPALRSSAPIPIRPTARVRARSATVTRSRSCAACSSCSGSSSPGIPPSACRLRRCTTRETADRSSPSARAGAPPTPPRPRRPGITARFSPCPIATPTTRWSSATGCPPGRTIPMPASCPDTRCRWRCNSSTSTATAPTRRTSPAPPTCRPAMSTRSCRCRAGRAPRSPTGSAAAAAARP